MTHRLVTASLPAAAIGTHCGYRFVGDTVELNADIQCYSAAHAGLDWALQLWADDAIKIAELPLGQLFPDNQGKVEVDGSTTAMLPAGGSYHALSLRLVAGFNGVYDCLHDQRNFDVLQGFQQPRLKDPVACRLVGDELVLDIAAIENPRDADNLSGTLVLELWSLASPYFGGAWVGTQIASMVIGCLHGQTDWTDCHYTEHVEPFPEDGDLTLMLREWTETGYVTRDYRSLPCPRVTAPMESVADQPAAEAPPAINPEDIAKAKSSAEDQISVNRASVEEICGRKGISRNVARAIVESRPFESFDDLLRVKGIGPKLLEKVRQWFRL